MQPLNLDEALEKFAVYRLESHEVENGDKKIKIEKLSPGSLRAYETDVRGYLDFLKEKGRTPGTESFEEYIGLGNNVPATSLKKISTVSSFFDFVNRSYSAGLDVVPKSLYAEFGRKKREQEKQPKIVSEQEYKEIIEKCTPSAESYFQHTRCALSCILARRTGITPSKLISLEESALHVSEDRFDIENDETHAFTPADFEYSATMRYLGFLHGIRKEPAADQNALFVNKHGEKYNESKGLRRSLRTFCKDVTGNPITLRDLRRTYLFINGQLRQGPAQVLAKDLLSS